jgi:hypothetical protein
MKKILFIVLCAVVLISLIASGQTKEEGKTKEPVTKLEAFLAKKGKLIVKDSYDLGEVAGRYGQKIILQSMIIFEPGLESQRIRGLRIEINEGGQYERSNTSFLDLDEIDSLSKALEYMVSLSTKWKDENMEYKEVIFSTKDDFKIGFYQAGIKQAAFSSSGYIGKTDCFFSSIQDLSSLKSMIDKGLKLLSEK